VDDMRIFCRSHAEARRALVLATELLRQRGLTVQSAKTKIREADEDLRKEFAGAVPSIKAVNKEYIDEAIEAGLLPQSEESVPVSVIDDLVNAEPDAMDPEVIRRAFRRFVIDTQTPNRSMFRYLLHRLGAARDAFAVEYCDRRLRSDPEDASAILRYFEALDDSHNLQLRACKALESKETEMYPFTQFLILGWLRRNAKRLRAATLVGVRRLAFRPEHPGYVRAEARALLGALGDHSDLDQIANLLKSSSDPLERAQLLCCLSRLEKGRRNSLIARLKNERPWGARAGVLAKQAD